MTYIFAKVFSRCQVLKSEKFIENGDEETLLSTLILSPVVLYDQLHIVECGVSVVFISQRSFQNLRTVVRRGSTLLFEPTGILGARAKFKSSHEKGKQ